MPVDAFPDRRAAGRILAASLPSGLESGEVVVLGLPRGGVPVAFEIAAALAAPLDVFLVRKLGVPGHEELAMGAVASGGSVVLHDRVMESLRINYETVQRVLDDQWLELERRERAYRRGRPRHEMRDRAVIVVDDGIATGSTMRAALAALRQERPATVVVAAPVGPQSAGEALADLADAVVLVRKPPWFRAVGEWYLDFSPVSDEEVCRLLDEAAARFAR